jgi:hypothetical protein
MSASNSIVFRMGGDTGGLRKAMADAEAIAEKSAKRISKKIQDATSGHGGHGSNNRAIGDALDAITGEKGWVMRMNMLQHSLPIAALAGMAISAEKMNEALEKSGEAAKQMREALATPVQSTVAQGTDAIQKQIEELVKANEEIVKSRSYMAEEAAVFVQPVKFVYAMITGQEFKPEGNEINAQLEAEGKERILELSAKQTAQTKAEMEERAKALHTDKESLPILEAERATREKIAAIKANKKLLPDVSMADQKNAASQGAEKVLPLKAEQAAGKINLATEVAITAVKKQGADVDVKSIEARLDGERKLAAIAEQVSKQAGDEANAKASATEAELEKAKRISDQHREQLEIETQIANFRGSADARHALALDLENAALLRRRFGAKADELREINAAVAKSEQAKLEFASSRAEKNSHLQDTLINAHTGEGTFEKLTSTISHLANAQKAQKDTDKDVNASPQQKADAAEKVHELEKARDNIYKSIDEANAEAKEETAELDEQLARHDQIAEKMRIQFDFQKKIAQAETDQLPIVAQELRAQQDKALALQAQNLQREVADKSKATISELAAHAHNQSGAAARQVESLEKRANAQRMQGHEDEADKLQEKADVMKKGIGALKDGEKDGANKRDQLKALKGQGSGSGAKGGPQPDVGNRSVKGRAYESGLDGFAKHMAAPTHMRDLTGGGGKTKSGGAAGTKPDPALIIQLDRCEKHLADIAEHLPSLRSCS